MSMPENSKDATRFVVVTSIAREDDIERSTYVFESSASLKEVFNQIFAEGRVGFLARGNLPYNIESLLI